MATSNSHLFDIAANLPIFAGIDKIELEKIMQHSHINEYKKGKLLFLEGDKAADLYVILEGWVKLFNLNIEGQEVVVQILDSKKTIAGSAILFSKNLPVSAQLIKDSKILSIPARIILETIKKNNELANNMLMDMASQSQEIIHQIGQIALKNAEQKVGWFLLNFLVTNNQGNNITFPYSKSVVAAYLSIKPETLSRVLHLFAENGYIKNTNSSITILDRQAFCQYCDTEISSKCQDCSKNGKCTMHK